MIILDTSGVLSAINAGQRHHEAAAAVLRAEGEPGVLSPFVLAEIDHLLATKVGVDAELELLGEVVNGAYRLAPFDTRDVEATNRVSSAIETRTSTGGCSIVVLALRQRRPAPHPR